MEDHQDMNKKSPGSSRLLTDESLPAIPAVTVSESTAQAPPDDQPSSPPDDADAERGPFDFGGLPNRNLKKNLGCG
jgi:hypothetical protein